MVSPCIYHTLRLVSICISTMRIDLSYYIHMPLTDIIHLPSVECLDLSGTQQTSSFVGPCHMASAGGNSAWHPNGWEKFPRLSFIYLLACLLVCLSIHVDNYIYHLSYLILTHFRYLIDRSIENLWRKVDE